MQFGYMPSFYADLLNETEFAVNNFDYIEITLKEELELYSPAYISKIKDSIRNLPLMGHIHWNIDFSGGDPAETEKALKSVEIFRELGAGKITVHPSNGKNRNDEGNFSEVVRNNINALKKINAFCESLNIQLLLENKIRPPFNRAEDFLYMTNEIPGIKITLDTGHAELVSPTEGDNFLKLLVHVVGHIHLHDTCNGYDHLFFEDSDKLNIWLDKFRKCGYNKTVTLEMFEKLGTAHSLVGSHTGTADSLVGSHTGTAHSLVDSHTGTAHSLVDSHTGTADSLVGSHTGTAHSLVGSHTGTADSLVGSHTGTAHSLVDSHTGTADSLVGSHTGTAHSLVDSHTGTADSLVGSHTGNAHSLVDSHTGTAHSLVGSPDILTGSPVSSTGILPVIPPPRRLESEERNRLLLTQLNLAKMFIHSCR